MIKWATKLSLIAPEKGLMVVGITLDRKQDTPYFAFRVVVGEWTMLEGPSTILDPAVYFTLKVPPRQDVRLDLGMDEDEKRAPVLRLLTEVP